MWKEASTSRAAVAQLFAAPATRVRRRLLTFRFERIQLLAADDESFLFVLFTADKALLSDSGKKAWAPINFTENSTVIRTPACQEIVDLRSPSMIRSPFGAPSRSGALHDRARLGKVHLARCAALSALMTLPMSLMLVRRSRRWRTWRPRSLPLCPSASAGIRYHRDFRVFLRGEFLPSGFGVDRGGFLAGFHHLGEQRKFIGRLTILPAPRASSPGPSARP